MKLSGILVKAAGIKSCCSLPSDLLIIMCRDLVNANTRPKRWWIVLLANLTKIGWCTGSPFRHQRPNKPPWQDSTSVQKWFRNS